LKVIWQPNRENANHWEIWIEGEKWREVHRAIFGRHPSFPSISSWEELPALFEAFEYRRVKGYLLWRLSTQSYHSELLAKLLRERLVSPQTIERVLNEFAAMGYLDDAAWMQRFMQTQKKRYGVPLILSKLCAKGFSQETIRQLTVEWKEEGEDTIEAIQHLLQTRYRSKDLTHYKEKQQVIAALLRKGYSFDQIRQALRECFEI
jgi:regulatory protein